MSAVDAFVPSLTQRCSLALGEKREKSAEEYLGTGSQSWESWVLEHSPDPPQNSRVLAASGVYQSA